MIRKRKIMGSKIIKFLIFMQGLKVDYIQHHYFLQQMKKQFQRYFKMKSIILIQDLK
ncbi:unnamed protein product [Paramecium pentaurelia]|uniref:Uncharacterized protein n=1 Tax=Paramecium pentaurelia TaxID=43138 RepID=A0A8S1UXL1_9CILI|nr:unnamed protein product [Paramecium pentaurelia]